MQDKWKASEAAVREHEPGEVVPSVIVPSVIVPSVGGPSKSGPLRIERFVYGGFGLASPADEVAPSSHTVLVPFVLPGELVSIASRAGGNEAELTQVIKTSSARVEPGCPHFGVCGGCHLQMASYPEQLRLKEEVLVDSLRRAGVTEFPTPETHGSEPWGYRNRIRLRLKRADGQRGDGEPVDGQLRFGYTRRGEGQVFLPITTCPIAAPLLWHAAETLLALAASSSDVMSCLSAAREVEFFANGDLSRLQITLLCPAFPKASASVLPSTFERAFALVAAALPELAGAGAVQASWSPLRLGRTLAVWGATGLAYPVTHGGKEERYWVERGGFFQVNRFLAPTLVDLVCRDLAGALAWDLFAGVGLFSRVLARSFDRAVAVEASPVSAAELQRSLARLSDARHQAGRVPGEGHRAEQKTTLAFLQQAVLERERPDLIVLDPPRAGVGSDVCELLLRVAASQLVYVSCDPLTLCRDLALLQGRYTITALHLVDLFPQTYHQEVVVTLERRS